MTDEAMSHVAAAHDRSNIARARELLAIKKREDAPTETIADAEKPRCPCCGGRMILIEVFVRGQTPATRQPLQPAPSGSTPHDCTMAVLQN
jgi:ABC-type ATPase with predicted acetyltransferase domain